MNESMKKVSPVSVGADEMQTAREDAVSVLAVNLGKVKKPGVYVLTFGCQQNEADGEKLLGMALSMGYEKRETPDGASLILVNTCCIREHAEKKALSVIGQFKHEKGKNPSLIIGVCGCMVVQEHRVEEFRRSYPYVDFTLGPAALWRLPTLIRRRMEGGKRVFLPETDETRVCEGLPIEREFSHRAWVSVMYGCNNFCSYCIVPYVRGRERSRRPEEILSEVRELVEDGCKDITLLGQNVNSYGKDCDFDCDFADLLQRIDGIDGEYTVHFMTSHPKDATEKLCDTIAGGRHIAHHFHLPLQAGSDDVLRRMNRHYDREKYLATVRYLREKVPDVTLTTDVMVGFPGETEEDFLATLAMLREVRFDMIYSFIYSPRKGTPAAGWEQVPDAVKSERFDRLLAVQNAVAEGKNRELVGKTLRVLCDGPSKTDASVYAGRTDGQKSVFFDATPEDTGKFLSVKIDRAEAFALWGTVVR